MHVSAILHARIKRPIRVYRGWWIVITGYFSQVVTTGATGWVFGVLIQPMERDLGWSRSELVGVLTLSSLLSGVLAAQLGPFVDQYGARFLMTASALLGGVCMVLVSQVTAPWQYYLCWAGVGLATPGLMTLGPGATIANWFIRRRAMAYTIYTFGSATAGIVLAPVIAGVAGQVGWRAAWSMMGVLMWGLAPLAWGTIRRRPEDIGLRPDGALPEPEQIASPGSKGGVVPREWEEPVWTVRQALRTRTFWLLSMAFTLTSLPASSIFVHMAPYITAKGFSGAAGATAISIYGFGVLIGRFVWGVVIARAGIYRALVSFSFAYGASIIAFLVPSSLPGIYAVTALLGLSIAGAQQLQAQAFPDYFGRRIVGALLGYSGLFFTMARAAAPLFAAVTYDATQSYVLAFIVFAGACGIAGVAFLLASPPSINTQIMTGVASPQQVSEPPLG